MSRWVKHAGDDVAVGDVLAEVETDKASFEITAPVEGTLLATFFEEGALVPVFATLCVIGRPGESIDAFRPPAASVGVRDSGLRIRSDSSSVTTHSLIPNPQSPITTTSEASRMSPRARRVAGELGVDTRALVGTGPGGRIIERDVRNATVSLALSEAARAAESQGRPGFAGSFGAVVDATSLQRLRAQIESLGPKKAPDITIDDLVAYCTIRALAAAALLSGPLHLRVVSETPQRLNEPVVPDADTLTLGSLSARIKEGSGAQREATFTVGIGAIHNGSINLSFEVEQGGADSAGVRRFVSTVKEMIEHAEYHLILRGS